jgi:hypothetical protein
MYEVAVVAQFEYYHNLVDLMETRVIRSKTSI